MNKIQAYAAAQAQTVRDYNHEGVELPEIIEGEIGPERAYRYQVAIEMVQSFTEDEFDDLQMNYGTFGDYKRQYKYKSKWREQLENQLEQKNEQTELIDSLKDTNIMLDEAYKKNSTTIEW